MQQSLLILGATGSIGTSTLDVVSAHPEKYTVKGIVAGRDWQKLAAIAKKFSVEYVAVYDEDSYQPLKEALSGTSCRVFAGSSGVLETCRQEYDITMAAIAGFIGLGPTIEATKHSKILAIANKESIVCAWNLIEKAAIESGCKIIPVDSEHSAIFQCLEQHNFNLVKKIAITASGGALRDYTSEQMKNVTPEIALKHPNWNMGAKVTIDCATLVNKGLEAIEAAKLFNFKGSQIDVLVHRESIIHGLVYYEDGSVVSQLGMPDMRSPIAFALGYPNRIAITHQVLDLAAIGTLSFTAPDFTRFPLLKLALSLLDEKQSYLIAFNTSNEIAVHAFLAKHIGFLDIASVINETLEKIAMPSSLSSLGDILLFNEQVISLANTVVKKFA